MTDADEIENYARSVIAKMAVQHYAEAEKLIIAAVAERQCNPEDLMLEVRYDGSILRVRPITDEERWLDWHSNNHGWNTTG
jgi:hypothetical protein